MIFPPTELIVYRVVVPVENPRLAFKVIFDAVDVEILLLTSMEFEFMTRPALKEIPAFITIAPVLEVDPIVNKFEPELTEMALLMVTFNVVVLPRILKELVPS
jgi:hypothetical protein